MAGFENGLWTYDGTTRAHQVYVFNWKTFMKTAGWAIYSSGDGDAIWSNTEDIITSSGSGANGFQNSNSWFVIGKNGKYYCIQNSNAGNQYRIMYSPSAGFVTGSPGANNTPDATDQVALLGGGTGASPSFAIWCGNATVDKFLAGADADTDQNGFWMAGIYSTETTARMAIMCDPMVDPGDTDTDPYCHYVSSTGGYEDTSIGDCDGATAYPKGFIGAASVAANFVGIALNSYYKRNAAELQIPYFQDGVMPMYSEAKYAALAAGLYSRGDAETSPVGIKGWSKLVLQVGQSGIGQLPMGSSGDETRNWVKVGAVWLPWGGTDLGTTTYALRVLGDAITTPGKDATPPTVTNISPTPGGNLAATRRAARITPITFDVDDVTPGIGAVLVTAKMLNSRETLVIYDGTTCLPPCDSDTSAAVVDGTTIHFTILPTDGGWWDSIEGMFIYAVDADGNWEALPV